MMIYSGVSFGNECPDEEKSYWFALMHEANYSINLSTAFIYKCTNLYLKATSIINMHLFAQELSIVNIVI
jgi:hypothetical protein